MPRKNASARNCLASSSVSWREPGDSFGRLGARTARFCYSPYQAVFSFSALRQLFQPAPTMCSPNSQFRYTTREYGRQGLPRKTPLPVSAHEPLTDCRSFANGRGIGSIFFVRLFRLANDKTAKHPNPDNDGCC